MTLRNSLYQRLVEESIEDEDCISNNMLFTESSLNDTVNKMILESLESFKMDFYELIFKIEIYIYCLENNFYQVHEAIVNSKDFNENNMSLIENLVDILTWDNHYKLAGEIFKTYLFKFDNG